MRAEAWLAALQGESSLAFTAVLCRRSLWAVSLVGLSATSSRGLHSLAGHLQALSPHCWGAALALASQHPWLMSPLCQPLPGLSLGVRGAPASSGP